MHTAPLPPARPPSSRRGAPRRVLVISGSVGAGHDGAAQELACRLRRAGVEVDVQDLLDVLPDVVAYVLRDGYFLSVDRVPVVFDRVFDALEGSGPVRGAMLGVCRVAEPGVARWLRATPYDAVVATYPLAGQVLGGLRRRGLAPMPVMTYLTDPAVHRSWLHPLVDLHLTVTAATAAQGESRYGLAMTVAGPLVPARFAQPRDPLRVQRLRAELGLPTGAPVALLVAGSQGLGDVLPSVVDVAAAGLRPLVLCGRNEGLRRRVAGVPGAVALGWRDDVHDLMALADVLVHNAGGLSFTEAMVAGLPAVSYRCIPGHGQANAGRVALRVQLAAPRRPAAAPDPADVVLGVLGDRPLAVSA